MVKKKEEKIEKVKTEEKPEINFMEILNDPAIASLLESGKNLFKKEKVDPDVCEINIKAPSEVVLKLFNIKG